MSFAEPLVDLPALLREDQELCDWLRQQWSVRGVAFGCNDFADYNWLTFDASTKDLTKAEWDRVGRLSFVERVSIESPDVVALVLERIRSLRKVHTVSLVDIELTEAVARQLCHCSSLTRLSVRASGAINSEEPGSEVRTAAIRLLAESSRLQALDLDRAVFHSSALAEAARIESLVELGLHRSSVDDEGLRHVGRMKSLKSLDLMCTAITSRGLKHLTALKAIRELRVDESRLDARAMATIVQLKSLVDLNLRATGIPETALVQLQELPQLERLIVGELPVTDHVMASIAKLSRLSDLWLGDTLVTDLGTAFLAALPRLQVLYLSGTAITDQTLNVIAEHLTELRTLNVNETAVSDAGLAKLTSLTKLEYLDFCETQARGACYDQLRKIPTIKQLSHSELPLLRRQRDFLRFEDVDYILDRKHCSLNAFIDIHADKIVQQWRLEINCLRDGVPAGMQPAHVNGVQFEVDFSDWREFERKEFRLQATDEPLGTLYIGWHHFAHRHHIRFGRRTRQRFRIRWAGFVHAEDFIVDARFPGSRFLVNGSVKVETVSIRDFTGNHGNIESARSAAAKFFQPQELGLPSVSETAVTFPISSAD